MSQFLQTLRSRWTVLAVVISAGITFGVHQANSDLAGTVFAGDATLVALIVPAAALANGLLEGRMLSFVKQLDDVPAGTDAADAARALRDLAGDVLNATKPLVRGFVFLLLSFGLSIFAMFHPNHHIWTGRGWYKVRVIDMLVGGALGFDVAALVLFLPFVWLLLDHQVGIEIRDMIGNYADQLERARQGSEGAGGGHT